MDAARPKRLYPGYTTEQLKAAVADGLGTAEMEVEIAAREGKTNGPVTNRISCPGPNLQQVPKTDEGRYVLNVFNRDAGRYWK